MRNKNTEQRKWNRWMKLFLAVTLQRSFAVLGNKFITRKKFNVGSNSQHLFAGNVEWYTLISEPNCFVSFLPEGFCSTRELTQGICLFRYFFYLFAKHLVGLSMVVLKEAYRTAREILENCIGMTSFSISLLSLWLLLREQFFGTCNIPTTLTTMMFFFLFYRCTGVALSRVVKLQLALRFVRQQPCI